MLGVKKWVFLTTDAQLRTEWMWRKSYCTSIVEEELKSSQGSYFHLLLFVFLSTPASIWWTSDVYNSQNNGKIRCIRLPWFHLQFRLTFKRAAVQKLHINVLRSVLHLMAWCQIGSEKKNISGKLFSASFSLTIVNILKSPAEAKKKTPQFSSNRDYFFP